MIISCITDIMAQSAKAFCVCTFSLELADHCQQAELFSTFKNRLKTELFHTA